MDGIVVRKARPADRDALARLARQAYCETFVEGFAIDYPAADLERFLEETYAPEAVATWIADASSLLLVAERGADLLAYVQAGQNDLPAEGCGPEDGELKRLYVLRAAQGEGLGRALLNAALDWLGERRIFIGVWTGNARAIALYRSRGFEHVGAHNFYVGETADLDLILARPNLQRTRRAPH